QPDSRTTPPHCLRRRADGQRTDLPVHVFDGRPWSPSLLAMGKESSMKSLKLQVLLALAATLATSAHAASKINLVTTTQDLADLAREVGGDKVNVEPIAMGYQDPHF